MIDDGNAIHYGAVERGTPVYGSDEVEVGKVDEVVDNFREHILDGIVIETPERKLLFVDAPEVARTAERGVTLTITAAEAASLPPPERAAADLPAEPARRALRAAVRARMEAPVAGVPAPSAPAARSYGGSPTRIHSPDSPRSSSSR